MPIQSGTRSTSKKKLTETISFQIATSGVSHEALVEQMVVDYHATTYCELAILLSSLRALALTHQFSHWTSSGDPFYADHLLFERLYNMIVPQIDKVAEKTIGMGGSVLLHPLHQVNHEALLMQTMCPAGSRVPNSAELARRSYEAEMHFMGIFDNLMHRMKCTGTISLGVENMLGEIADAHEEAIYLLRQRVIG
jgi:DNA-binding ferritin-like protein